MRRAATVVMVVAVLAAGACSSSGSGDGGSAGPDPIEEGYVALCNDGNYSNNLDLTATCSGGDGIDRWLAAWGECDDGKIVPLGEDACGYGTDLKRLLPDYELPSAAEAIEEGYVALCNDGNYSNNLDLTATCSGGDGIDRWLAEWGECDDGEIVRLAQGACGGTDLKQLMPADYEPPPSTTLPPATTAALVPTTAPPTTAPPTTAPPATAPPTTAAPRAYYPNCDAARAAGVAPLYRGEPGYSTSLDRDGDGIACE